MNDPVSFSHAAIGREMHFFNTIYGSSHRWRDYAHTQASIWSIAPVALKCPQLIILQREEGTCSKSDVLNGLLAAQFSRQSESYISMKLDKEDLAKDFEISLKVRTYDQDGLLFASIVRLQIAVEETTWMIIVKQFLRESAAPWWFS